MKSNFEETFAMEAVPHLKDLYRTAARLTRDAAAAEDVVQETFLQAWRSFADYEAGTNCRAWLYKILFFKMSHHRRYLAVQSKYFQSDDEEGTLFGQAAAPETVASHLTDEDVVRAVDDLSPNYRAVVLLADVEEFDYKEIAQILQIPIGTVMSRLFRARTQLRRSLAGVAYQFGIKKATVARRQAAASAAC